MIARQPGFWLLLCLCACSRSPLLPIEARNDCVVFPPGTQSTHRISAEVSVDRTDILFLIDTSVSMADEIEQIRAQLVDVLVPQIREQVSYPHIGVAAFSDFGQFKLGQRSHPYQLLQPLTEDVDKVLAAIEDIYLEFGGDGPESQLEALYQAATGEGLGIYVEAKPDCPNRTRGGACFRQGSFGVIMLFTDAPMRGVKGLLSSGAIASESGDDPRLAPELPLKRGYEETLAALAAENLRVLGLWSGGDGPGLDDMRRMARDSGAVDAAGEPIVFDIGVSGAALGDGVVQTLATVTSGLRVDVEITFADGDLTDDLDPRTLLQSVRAIEAEPAHGAIANGRSFLDAVAGTRVTFELVFNTQAVPATAFDQRFPLHVSIDASDGTQLLSQTVDLVIAPDATCW